MRFGSTAKVLAECKIKYYNLRVWQVLGPLCVMALAFLFF